MLKLSHNHLLSGGFKIPLYEFYCEECKTYFELGCEKALNTQEIICVDCGLPEVRLLSCDEELSTRVSNLVLAIQDLAQRIEVIEGNMADDLGPNDTARKDKKTVN